jgi:hypothetical protein
MPVKTMTTPHCPHTSLPIPSHSRQTCPLSKSLAMHTPIASASQARSSLAKQDASQYHQRVATIIYLSSMMTTANSSMPSRSHPARNCTGAYQRTHKLLQSRGLKPMLQRINNEASDVLKSYMSAEDIDFQLTPAGIHQRNAAEQAIQTFKVHCITIICSLHPKFPLNMWDQVLPQTLIMLNLMHPSKINPQLSAYHQGFGAFNYNRTPLAPPGIKIYVHAQPRLCGAHITAKCPRLPRMSWL